MSNDKLLKKRSKQLDRMRSEFEKALPQNISPERFVRIAQTCLKRNPKLLTCDTSTFWGSLMRAAELGLEPGVEGQCYLVPLDGQVEFWMGYRGLTTLMYRSGAERVDAHIVYENDEFDLQYGSEQFVKHRPWKLAGADSPGDYLGAYFLCQHERGETIKFMTLDEIKQVRNQSPAYRAGGDTPWKTNFVEMARKTVLKNGAKYVPYEIVGPKRAIEDDEKAFEYDPDEQDAPQIADVAEEDYEVSDFEESEEPETPDNSDPGDQQESTQDSEKIDATDAAVELAEDNDIALRDVEGTGKNGRIIKKDVKRVVRAREEETTPDPDPDNGQKENSVNSDVKRQVEQTAEQVGEGTSEQEDSGGPEENPDEQSPEQSDNPEITELSEEQLRSYGMKRAEVVRSLSFHYSLDAEEQSEAAINIVNDWIQQGFTKSEIEETGETLIHPETGGEKEKREKEAEELF